MASGTNLPPQAYTREILTAAFNWLQTQPESVRKLATTPDALVGIYTRARRLGNAAGESDAPVSSQNFMTDLRHLAEGLKEFEEPRETRRSAPAQFTSTMAMSNAPQAPPPGVFTQPMPLQTQQNLGQQNLGLHANTESVVGHFRMTESNPSPSLSLNERSLSMIQEVKNQFNLSTDIEALNMMLSIGYKSLKTLLA